jgi:DNA polymerase-3 subunit chi
MGAVYFYHMTESPLEQVLPMLLGKARAAGWRIEVRGTDKARLDRLDQSLWQGSPTDFLAHGRAGGDHDTDQPILLTLDQPAANTPDCLTSVDGADLRPDEVIAAARSMILFDGGDTAAVDRARGQWKLLTDAGCAALYWGQEQGGSWVKKAEKNQ